jgi:hypothetical protein
MIPYGDRRDLAHSGSPQNQRQSTPTGMPRRDHVMSVFIQGECFDEQYRGTLRAPPQDKLLQRPESRQFAFESSQRFDWEVSAIDDLHGTECRAKRRRNQRFWRRQAVTQLANFM